MDRKDVEIYKAIEVRSNFIGFKLEGKKKEKETPRAEFTVHIDYAGRVMTLPFYCGLANLQARKGVFPHNVPMEALKPNSKGVREINSTYFSRALRELTEVLKGGHSRMGTEIRDRFIVPDPTKDIILYCLFSDCESILCRSFKDWADDLGYNSDSISDRQVYDACQKELADLCILLREGEKRIVSLGELTRQIDEYGSLEKAVATLEEQDIPAKEETKKSPFAAILKQQVELQLRGKQALQAAAAQLLKDAPSIVRVVTLAGTVVPMDAQRFVIHEDSTRVSESELKLVKDFLDEVRCYEEVFGEIMDQWEMDKEGKIKDLGSQ